MYVKPVNQLEIVYKISKVTCKPIFRYPHDFINWLYVTKKTKKLLTFIFSSFFQDKVIYLHQINDIRLKKSEKIFKFK